MANPGFFFAAYAIVIILGRALGARILDLYSREKIILPCLTTFIISMVVLAYSKTLPMFILVAVIWGSGNAFLQPTLVAYALDRAISSPGTVMGTYTAIVRFGGRSGTGHHGCHPSFYQLSHDVSVFGSRGCRQSQLLLLFCREKEPSRIRTRLVREIESGSTTFYGPSRF